MNYKRIYLQLITYSLILIPLFFFSCKKNTTENINLSKAKTIQVNAISNPMGYNNPDSIKAYSGTMVANTTYTIVGNVQINKGDTIFVQPGVTVCVENDACIDVEGVLICVGTQASPIWFTVCGRTKTDNIGEAQALDNAWSGGTETGLWPGIECDTCCTLLVLKWTHIEFVGAGATCKQVCSGVKVGATKTNFGIFFQNLNGNFIMEDSWLYGCQDDAVRVDEGHFDIMRNTFEKTGYIGGDCNNIKGSGVGDCAYNLYVGCATNGSKAANTGILTTECNMSAYNNTYINCGYRQNETGRGADIDYEAGAEGSSYNNLIIDCKFGFRIVGGSSASCADTIHCFYGNTYIYGDSVTLTTQFYPVGYITKPDAYVMPNPSITGYVYSSAGAVQPTGTELTDDQALVGANNPMFVSFSLPENPSNFPGMTTFLDVNNDNEMHNYNFHLASGSPAIGIGYTNASFMLNACASVTNAAWGPQESPPCADMGCYPSVYTGGNQHVNGEQ